MHLAASISLSDQWQMPVAFLVAFGALRKVLKLQFSALSNGSNDPNFQADKKCQPGIFFDLFFFFLSMERSGVDGELSALLERLLPPGWVFCGVHLSHCALLN